MEGKNGAATQEILPTVVGDRPAKPTSRVVVVVDGVLVAPEPPLLGLQRRGWLAHRWEGGTLLEYLAPELWEELQALGETAQQVAAAIAPWQREPSLVVWDGESQFTSHPATVAGGPYLQRVQAWAQTLIPPAIVVVVLHRAPPDLPLAARSPRLGWLWGRKPSLTWVLLSPDRALGDRLRSLGWRTFTRGDALQQYLGTQMAPPLGDRGQAAPPVRPWLALVRRWGLPLAAIAGLGVGWVWGRTVTVPPAVPVFTAPTVRRATLTVYFPRDSTVLTPLQRQRLRDFWANHQEKAGTLHVVGHADDGPHNQSLSEQRAWAVVAFLRQNLAERHRLQIGHRGAAQPVHSDPAFNRRVKLTFIY